MTEIDLNSYRDKMRGCLIGGALGDAYGYPLEFMSLAEIRSRFGDEGPSAPVPDHAGHYVVSDDTQMTLFTVEGLLLSDKKDTQSLVGSIRSAYLDWLDTQGVGGPHRTQGPGRLRREAVLRHRRAPGATCLGALAAGGEGTPEHPINDSKGCGGIMRVAPVGLLAWLSPDEVFEIGARSAALTHGHPSGYLSAGVFAAIIRHLVSGEDLRSAAEKAATPLRQWPGCEETEEAINAALSASEQVPAGPRAIDSLGEGWVGEEALAIGLYAGLVARDFREAVRMAAVHSGDSDSTASLAGQLWGAANGSGQMPRAWMDQVDVMELLEALSGQLADMNKMARDH